MKLLAESGCDYLELALGRCRQRGITPGVSVRMNDMHGAREPDTWPDNSHFYKQHPEYRLPGPMSLGLGLNYEHAAVREHYLMLIKELVGNMILTSWSLTSCASTLSFHVAGLLNIAQS